MSSVFTFVRSDQEILEALTQVFGVGSGTARELWAQQAEVLVEPTGWEALWKLSKEFCRKFEVRFPCVAYVTVTLVDYEALTASVEVLSVQHESITLPETVQDVALIELWPTKKQREQCVNAASTADFIDLLRFYYTDIWMPWDDQDDKVVLAKTIEDRMQLWSELHNGSIPNCVARSITLLRNSTINTYDKLKELDLSLCDAVGDEDDSMLPPSYISTSAELTARLDSYMSQWMLYEVPVIREQYIAKARDKWAQNKNRRNVAALWQGGSIQEFSQLSSFLSTHVTSDHTLTVTVSAEEALALEPEKLVVCSKLYEIPEMPLSQITICSFGGAILQASDMRSCLLMLSEECTLRDLSLSCTLANTVVVMRHGALKVTRCCFTDDGDTTQANFAQGVVAMDGAKITLEDCTFENFYSGIVVHRGAYVELRKCVIKNCGVGVQMYFGARVKLTDCTVSQCSENSIRCETDSQRKGPNQMEGLELVNCKIGSGDLQKEVLVVTQDII